MLPARFHTLRDHVMAQVDHVFAEPVGLKFNKNKRADPDRPAVVIEAVLRVGGGKETNFSGGLAKSWRTRITAQHAELHINRTANPDLVVKTGDEVRALARPGQPWFEVLAIDDRGETRLVLQLGEAAG